ncbi:MAG: PTS sugar transporter subunit IIA [Candidatus Aminicenantes bacterium]|nr:PTS sugar transporter subunit IIA [Candidatus Aminicenantes bacterium]
MDLGQLLKKENIFIADSFENTGGFYAAYAEFLRERGIIKNCAPVKDLFVERENIQSTAIKKGAAAPHVFSEEFSGFIFSLALIRAGLDFKAPDEQDVYLIFLLMSSRRDAGLHLKSLAHIARLVSCTDIVAAVRKAADAAEIHKIILEKEKLI